MATIIKNADDIANGVRADLMNLHDLLVEEGVTVSRADAIAAADYAVTATGSGHSLDILGTIINQGSAIQLGDGTADTNNQVFIGEDGYVRSLAAMGAAFEITGSNLDFDNYGTIRAANKGLSITLPNAADWTTLINNYGLIRADRAIHVNSGLETVILTNRAIIIGTYDAYRGADNVDIVNNLGRMEGGVHLGGGNDVFDGSAGELIGQLRGDDGNDVLRSGRGDDYIDGGDGADTMQGGPGNDTYNVTSAADRVIESAKQGFDTVLSSVSFQLGPNVEALTIGLNATRATGNGLANTLQDIDGNATLSGLAGNDRLIGQAGSQRLVGGLGADRLTGGQDGDRFIFNAAAESRGSLRDTIVDFTRAQGDVIQLSAIDADATRGGNQAFDFIGKAAFSGKAGELRYQKVGSDTHILADTNGDRVADMTIVSDKVLNFARFDFIL